MRTDRSGMTLVEVLLAAMLLGLGMMTIFTSLSRCLRLMQASRDVQKIQLVFDLGEAKYPLNDIASEEDIEKLEIEDSNLLEDKDGVEYTFTRTFDQKEIVDDSAFNDHLYTVRTSVSWGSAEDQREEHVRLLWIPSVDEYTKQ